MEPYFSFGVSGLVVSPAIMTTHKSNGPRVRDPCSSSRAIASNSPKFLVRVIHNHGFL